MLKLCRTCKYDWDGHCTIGYDNSRTWWSVKEGECMNLDRFSQGLPDPQDAEVMAYCEGCDGEIYEGEDVYVVYGAILHADWDCLYHYVDPDFMTVEEALGLGAKK